MSNDEKEKIEDGLAETILSPYDGLGTEDSAGPPFDPRTPTDTHVPQTRTHGQPQRQSSIREFTEDELKQIAENMARAKQTLEEAKRPKPTTSFLIFTMERLDSIKKNTDMLVLLLHTLFCLTCGAILALGVYLGHGWLQAGGSFTGLICFITLLLSYVNPKGSLSKMLNSEKFSEELQKLSERDFKKLTGKMSESQFFQKIFQQEQAPEEK